MSAHKNARTTPFGELYDSFACSRRAPCASGSPSFAAKAGPAWEPQLGAAPGRQQAAAPWLTMSAPAGREYRMTGEEIACGFACHASRRG